ncbi:MAG TPA: DUF4870 domain-containing protein [Oceanipulchritudo sp.]|nr:DUF4870 domain-containing protein [Oceanipulchritudo sp.]
MNEHLATTTTSDRLWNVMCHISLVLGLCLILPLIIYLVTKNDRESPIPVHAKEALNFHITLMLLMLISAILVFVYIGALLLFVLGVASVVLSIVGAVKASRDEVYRYPFTIRFVK